MLVNFWWIASNCVDGNSTLQSSSKPLLLQITHSVLFTWKDLVGYFGLYGTLELYLFSILGGAQEPYRISFADGKRIYWARDRPPANGNGSKCDHKSNHGQISLIIWLKLLSSTLRQWTGGHLRAELAPACQASRSTSPWSEAEGCWWQAPESSSTRDDYDFEVRPIVIKWSICPGIV